MLSESAIVYQTLVSVLEFRHRALTPTLAIAAACT
jgi:hypothetical protein